MHVQTNVTADGDPLVEVEAPQRGDYTGQVHEPMLAWFPAGPTGPLLRLSVGEARAQIAALQAGVDTASELFPG